MDVGGELRQAREQRGLSLDELSRLTKISATALGAIDANDIAHLPGGIFTRGFVKAYAREVGLDPADVARRYAAQFEPIAPPTVDTAAGSERPPAAAREPSHPGIHAFLVDWLDRPVVRLAGLLALVVVAYLLLWRSPTQTALNRAETPTARDSSSVASPQPRSEVATAGAVVGAVSPSVGRSDLLRIELLPGAAVWVSATADGSRVAYRMMQAGDSQAIEVRNELVLRVGEPAKFAFTINGRSGRLLGRPGQPATARITLQNYADFLAR